MRVFILTSGGVSFNVERGTARMVLSVEDAPAPVCVDVESLRKARQHTAVMSPPREAKARRAEADEEKLRQLLERLTPAEREQLRKEVLGHGNRC